MKTLLILAILAFAGTVSARDQKLPSGTPAKIRQDLIHIEHEIGRANLDCDFKYFDRVEAEEFIFTDSSGSVSDKKQDLAGEKSCHKSDATYDVDDAVVQLYGSTAVVTGRVTTARNKDGKVLTRSSRFTDVFVWRDGRWQLVAGHSSRIPEPVPK